MTLREWLIQHDACRYSREIVLGLGNSLEEIEKAFRSPGEELLNSLAPFCDESVRDRCSECQRWVKSPEERVENAKNNLRSDIEWVLGRARILDHLPYDAAVDAAVAFLRSEGVE